MNKRNFLHNNTTLRQCKNTMLLTQITDKNQLWLHLSELSHASLIHKLSHYTSRLHYIITPANAALGFPAFLMYVPNTSANKGHVFRAQICIY